MEIVKVNEVLEAIDDLRRKKELESSIAYGHGFYAGIAKIEKLIKEKACTADEIIKHGHWAKVGKQHVQDWQMINKCSVCGKMWNLENELITAP